MDQQDFISRAYVGARIQLTWLEDPLFRVEPGTQGVVERIDSHGSLAVRFDTGRTAALILGVDEFEVIEPPPPIPPQMPSPTAE